MNFKYTVLENGFEFILTAINDLLNVDVNATDSIANKRYIKYSLLHLSSGIELVLKHRLLREHWTYVFEDMNKAKKDKLDSGDFTSARNDVIIQRLRTLCDVEFPKDEEIIIKTLRAKRNSAEHFSLCDDIPTLKTLIHSSITLLINKILEYYNPGTFTDEEHDLFLNIQSSLHKFEQHYDDALAMAKKELEPSGMEGEALTCPQCFEDFLLIDESSYDGYGGAKCTSCSYEALGEKAARDYISNVMGVTEHDVATIYGGELPLFDCPNCNDWSLVFDEVDDNATCFSCGFNENCVVLLTCSNCDKRFVCVQYADDDCASCPECGEDVPFDDE